MVTAEAFYEGAQDVLKQVMETQLPKIKKVAGILADCIERGGVIHLFGSGHSKAFAMEMANRAGGLGPTHMMAIDDLVRKGLRTANDMEDPSIERDPAVAHELLSCYDIRPEDAAIIISNSGRNGALVEMALLMKQKGLPVICVTSMQHTTAVSSRHPSGKLLYEVADEVIDNCGPMGDALLEDDRLGTKVCSVSSVAGAVIAQCLTAEITKALLDHGQTVPVLMSANLDGADEWNGKIRDMYKGRMS